MRQRQTQFFNAREESIHVSDFLEKAPNVRPYLGRLGIINDERREAHVHSADIDIEPIEKHRFDNAHRESHSMTLIEHNILERR